MGRTVLLCEEAERAIVFDDRVGGGGTGRCHGSGAGEAHDRVSIQYELMHDLLNGHAAHDYAIVDGEELKELTVTNIGTRKIKVPFGEFEAVGIQHQARNSSRISTLWCVAELGYLPVLIEQHRHGKLRLRAELTDYLPVSGQLDIQASQ